MLFTHSGLVYTQSPIPSPIWNSSSTWSFWQSSIFSSFVDLVWYIIEEDKDLVWFAMLAWSIWNSRNYLCTTSDSYLLSQLQHIAAQIPELFQQNQPVLQTSSMPIFATPTRWSPPFIPSFKINFDEVVYKETNEAGLGVVVRDSLGLVHASLSEKVLLPPFSDDVEAMATAWAILFVQELGLSSHYKKSGFWWLFFF